MQKKVNQFLLFSEEFSRKTDIFCNASRLYEKNKHTKLGRETCIKLKINSVKNKCCVLWLLFTIICITHVQKDFKIQTVSDRY